MINVMIRPGTTEFLARMGELYEVVVFTASLAEYAEPLVKVLDTTNVISYLLYRQHCTPLNGIYVKDLSLLGRNIKDVILIDNSPNSFLFQPENAYHITNFFDDKTDRELDRLAYFLEKIVKVTDVRPIEEHRRRFDPPHPPKLMKFVKVKYQESIPNQEQEEEQAPEEAQGLEENQEEDQEEQQQDSSLDLREISLIQDNDPKPSAKKREEREKAYNAETEPDLRRDEREKKNKSGSYGDFSPKAVPLTERVVVNDRLIPQALDSSVDLELPSPKESDGLINHRDADTF